MDGLEATRLIRATHPNTPVLILSAFGDADLLVRARRVGAAGYVLKSGSEWQLRVAIWEAVRRDIPCCRSMAVAALQRLAPEQRPDVSANGHLSARELEVLILLAQGKTNVEIADELAITPHTAKAHVDHIFGKLGVKARTHAAVRAVELGLISGRSG